MLTKNAKQCTQSIETVHSNGYQKTENPKREGGSMLKQKYFPNKQTPTSVSKYFGPGSATVTKWQDDAQILGLLIHN